jgi:hypothetical protein
VTDPIDAAGAIAELFTWIGVLLGGLVLVPGLLRAALLGHPNTHEGVVVDAEEHSVTFRWFGDDGDIHEASAPPLRGHPVSMGDDVTVYTPRSRPERGRLDPVDHLGRSLRLIGWVLLGIGLAAAVLSIVLLFL